MKYSSLTKTTTIKDVERFVKYIYDELEVNFHPVDGFDGVNYYETGKKTFSKTDSEISKILLKIASICVRETMRIS